MLADEPEEWLASLLRAGADEEKMTDKQIKILRAAVEMFAEKGFSATSTSEIAQRAGVAEGTIFRHYKTKKDLLISIVAPAMAKVVGPFLLRDFRQVINAEYEHFEDFLRAVLKNRLEFALKNISVLKIMLHEIPFHPELRNEFMKRIFPQVADRLERIIRHFQAKGEIVDIPPYTLIRMAVSSMAGYILTRSLIAPENEWDDALEIERTVQFIMHGVGAKSTP